MWSRHTNHTTDPAIVPGLNVSSRDPPLRSGPPEKYAYSRVGLQEVIQGLDQAL